MLCETVWVLRSAYRTPRREVAGALLPFRVESELAHPLIGKVLNVYEGFETGVEVGAGWFSLAPEER